VDVTEETIELDGQPVLIRAAPASLGAARASIPAAPASGDVVPVYLHGVPTSSRDMIPFLERAGGLAPDLPGFGRSGKGGHLDYSPEGLARFVLRLLDERSPGPVALVGHQWGGTVAALVAQMAPDRVHRLVLIDALPPRADGFRWPRAAGMLRAPVLGELVLGSTNRALLRRWLHRGAAAEGAWPDEAVDAVWADFDHGTQRALLRLHRSAGREPARPGATAAQAPTLVVWGERDPWLPPALAGGFTASTPEVTVEIVPGAGHWPWLGRPEVVERVVAFATAAA
jgi:pimeloyl-ACP methyl ester carboxylesterase